jgi:hypothetical protein
MMQSLGFQAEESFAARKMVSALHVTGPWRWILNTEAKSHQFFLS